MRFSFSVVVSLLLVPAIAGPGVIHAATAQSTSQSTTYYEPAISTLASDLERDYVSPATAQKYAEMLRRNLKSGAYAGITDPAEISKRLTDDLQNVTQDLHLRVRPVATAATATAVAQPQKNPVEGAAWLADGVAYIRFNLFPGSPESVAATEKFMREHATAKAIIIDARHNHGGGGDETNVMLPYLFSKRTSLIDMELAGDVAKELGFAPDQFFLQVDAPAGKLRLEQVVEPSPTEHRLFTAKVYYLTSLDTGSAAEALAFIFKLTHRATIVGERTRGMDHFGKFLPIGQNLDCFLPAGRTFDPATGADWEGGGVTPDVAVAPDDALQVALKLAES